MRTCIRDGMPLRGRHHRLGSGVGEAHRPAELPGRERQVRLDREVELAAEPAADRRRHDPHRAVGRDRGSPRARRGPCAATASSPAPRPGRRPARHTPPRARCRRARGRPVSNSPSTPTSADANAASRSPRRTLPRTSTFPPRSSWSLGASEACASSIDSRGGSSCQLTGNVERSSAAIAAGSTDDHRDRLAAEPHLPLGEHRLIGGGGDHAEAVAAVDVGGGQHRLDPRRGGHVGRQVAEREARPGDAASARCGS